MYNYPSGFVLYVYGELTFVFQRRKFIFLLKSFLKIILVVKWMIKVRRNVIHFCVGRKTRFGLKVNLDETRLENVKQHLYLDQMTEI